MAETIEELRKRAKAAREASEAKVREANDERERRKLEGEIKLAEELDDKLGVRGRDYLPVFSAKTGDMVVVRAPSEAAYQSFRSKVEDQKSTIKDQWELVNSCRVYPDPSALGKLTEETPALLDQMLGAIAFLAGVRADAAGKE